MSPSILLTTEIEESETVFTHLLSVEGLDPLTGDDVFCFSGDLKVSF